MTFKQLVDKYIIHQDGIWQFTNVDSINVVMPLEDTITLTKEYFLQRAKELGFVGKYRWGVEYATDGEEPDLPKDTLIKGVCYAGDTFANWEVCWLNFRFVKTFSVTDVRYKPQDVSYLQQKEEPSKEKEQLVNAAQELLNTLSDMTDAELSILGNAPEVQQLVDLLKSQEAEKIIQKQALALYRSVNYNMDDLPNDAIIKSKRFQDYVKAIKDGWTHPNVSV